MDDYCYKCLNPVSMCACDKTITNRMEWELWSRGRIEELEALLTRVQISMGVKRLPNELMRDIRAALEGEQDG